MSVEIVIFLISVAVLFVTSISILITTLRTGSPPTPSGPALRRTIVEMLASADIGEGAIYELGSGWGGLAQALARANPDRVVIALERSFVPWLAAETARRLLGPANLQFRRQDLSQAELSDAAAAVCYLSGETLARIAPVLQERLPAGCRVVSATFAWPGLKPEAKVTARDVFRSPVYLYRIRPGEEP
ncbi:hypothetical protein [Hwanghaeella sp.]|uniref:hypothetical protein n=1 Tax=Hwanghaeella sp. TaxID=2605943 RepID=UPI003CCC09C6